MKVAGFVLSIVAVAAGTAGLVFSSIALARPKH